MSGIPTLGNYFVLIIAILGVIGSIFVGALSSGGLAGLQLVGNNDSNSNNLHQLHSADAATLPLVLEDHFKLNDLLGDAKAKPKTLQIFDNGVIDPDRHCEFCSLLRYTPGSLGIAGAAYSIDSKSQKPLDISGAKRVHLFVMGDEGGEKIKLTAAGKEAKALEKSEQTNTTNKSTAKPITNATASNTNNNIPSTAAYALTTKTITLTNDWLPVEIDLSKVKKADLVGVTHPFGIEILKGKGSEKQGVYFKYITFDEKTAQNPVPADLGITNATALANATNTALLQPKTSLTAKISANSTNGTAPSTIEFNAQVISGTEPYSFLWSFGDGDKANAQNVTHTFVTPDTYNTTLTVKDANDTTASDSIIVKILGVKVEQARGVNDTNALANESSASGESNNSSTSTSSATSQEKSKDLEKTINSKNNTPPIAKAEPNVIIAHPGDTVILDGKASTDPEGNKLSFAWSQTDGSEIEINDKDTATPSLHIPSDIHEDAKITIELVVSDGNLESKPDQVTINVDYLEKEDTTAAQDEKVVTIAPDDLAGKSIMQSVIDGGKVWDVSKKCLDQEGTSGKDIAKCLSDESPDTFVSAGEPKSIDIFSFGPDIQQKLLSTNEGGDTKNNKIASINYLSVDIEAKKKATAATLQTGGEENSLPTAFVSFILYDREKGEYQITPAISISSDSFETYSYRWTSNPITNKDWDSDSLDPIMIGFAYPAGSASVDISRFELSISFIASPITTTGTSDEDAKQQQLHEKGPVDSNNDTATAATNSQNEGNGADDTSTTENTSNNTSNSTTDSTDTNSTNSSNNDSTPSSK